MSVLKFAIECMERGLIPDVLLRAGIRKLCTNRTGVHLVTADKSSQLDTPGTDRATAEFYDSLYNGPIAPLPEKANEQHYEVPAEFFELVLGPHRKYSCCYWPSDVNTLEQAEIAALEQTCRHAELQDGMQILELGCGWGSLSLWMARNFPNSQIVSVSNSASQRRYIQAEACRNGINNLEVITADMNEFSIHRRFDRVVSVEMFEHMRNYQQLLKRISTWLTPEGKLFVHIFCHARSAYPFESEGDENWMGRYFFSGGMMPSESLLHRFDRDLRVTHQWKWNGMHYCRTSEAWLKNLDDHRDEVLSIMKQTYGPANAHRWLIRWRVFFISVAELFAMHNGTEWLVAHYLLAPATVAKKIIAANPVHTHVL